MLIDVCFVVHTQQTEKNSVLVQAFNRRVVDIYFVSYLRSAISFEGENTLLALLQSSGICVEPFQGIISFVGGNKADKFSPVSWLNGQPS